MKKLCLALATLSLSAATYAQSSVSIGGMIDIGIYKDTSGNTNVGSIQRSNIAFSGTEDLGGGYKANFKMSTRFEPGTGALEGASSKPFFHGESTVGFSGPFGSVKFGRALDAMNNNDWRFDPWFNFNRVASPAWDLWHYNFSSDPFGNNGTAEYGRLNSGIFYDSPSMNGFSVHTSLAQDNNPAAKNNPLGISLIYTGSAFTAMLSHEKNSLADTDTFIGLSGKIGNATIMAAHDVSKAAASGSTAKANTLGIQYPIGALTINGGIGRVNVDGTVAEKMVSTGVVYSLSKRTSVYADVARKEFTSSSNTVYGVGIAHNF